MILEDPVTGARVRCRMPHGYALARVDPEDRSRLVTLERSRSGAGMNSGGLEHARAIGDRVLVFEMRGGTRGWARMLYAIAPDGALTDARGRALGSL